MISLFSRLKNHRLRDGLVKKLAKSPPPQNDAARDTPAQAPSSSAAAVSQEFDSFLERGATAPDAVLRKSRRILQRTRALTDPREREHVAAWVRNSVNERPPNNLKPVEALLRSCRLHDMAGLLLSLSALDASGSNVDHRALPAWANSPERRLHDTLFWCERLTVDEAEQMHDFFSSPTGKRWIAAVRDALEVALQNAPPGIDPAVRRTPLARLLVPYVTSKRMSDAVVDAAADQLRDGDVEAAQWFFLDPTCQGTHWQRVLAENLEDMRRCSTGRGARVRNKSF